jgi:N6-adenosine-specific RNA methylase IME4
VWCQMIFDRIEQLTPLRYGLILADPPWEYRLRSGPAAVPYKTMPTEEICAMNMGMFAQRDCALLLWGTSPMLPDALRVMSAWGFTFRGKGFCWAKTNKWRFDQPASEVSTWFMGRGYSSRANTEDCWLGTIGSPFKRSGGVRELIVAPIGPHSQKPEAVYDRCQRLYDGPYLDLFSRKVRPGWDQFGDEVVE